MKINITEKHLKELIFTLGQSNNRLRKNMNNSYVSALQRNISKEKLVEFEALEEDLKEQLFNYRGSVLERFKKWLYNRWYGFIGHTKK